MKRAPVYVTSALALYFTVFVEGEARAQEQPPPEDAPSEIEDVGRVDGAPDVEVDAGEPEQAVAEQGTAEVDAPSPDAPAVVAPEASPDTSQPPRDAEELGAGAATPPGKPESDSAAGADFREAPSAPIDEATGPWPLTVTASTFSRFELREGYDTLGVSRGRFVEGDTTVYRVRLGLRTQPLRVTEDVRALVQFTPQASGQYGKTATVAEQNVGLYEGYFRVEGRSLALDVGRFSMNYGDSLVVGSLDWHQTGRSFEGARVRQVLDRGWIDGFVTQTPRAAETTAEGHPTLNEPVFAGDTYFWGLYVAMGAYVRDTMDLDLYLLGSSSGKTRGVPVDAEDPEAGTFTRHSATELTFGVRAKDRITAELDYRIEAGVQGGARPDPNDAGRTARSVTAYQVEGEVGLRFVEPLRLALGGASASGDDPTSTDRDEGWNELYPTGHKFLGLMDVVGGRSNVWSAMAKLQAKLGESSVLNVDYHYFGRHYVPAQLGKRVGSEVDTYLVHKFGGPLSARALYGIFLPNQGHFGSSNAAHYGEAELALVF